MQKFYNINKHTSLEKKKPFFLLILIIIIVCLLNFAMFHLTVVVLHVSCVSGMCSYAQLRGVQLEQRLLSALQIEHS